MSRLWLLLLCTGIVGSYALFLVLFWRHTGPKDGDQFLVFHALQYWNAAMFGLPKQWTPLLCSGLSMAGEPQIPFMSASMLLTYATNPLIGVRIATVLYLVAGYWGAYLYSGKWLPLRQQRILAATLFIGNGFFFCRLGKGHFDFVPFLTLPLLLYLLHRTQAVPEDTSLSPIARALRFLVLSLTMGGIFALVVDGSPVAIIHLLFWAGLYATILSAVTHRLAPIGLFSAAVFIAGFLDAGYLWPMLQAQAQFPRRTMDAFTSPLSFLWFAILPLRGKVLPANGNGHELSVFIGPVLAYLLWSRRRWLLKDLPGSMRSPLTVVSLVSLVLGMGSLCAIHIPIYLSPFDILRSLPGFRSVGVTGRFWGFLALPLSLMSARALWDFAMTTHVRWRLHGVFILVLLFQLGFQAETLAANWVNSPLYRLTSRVDAFSLGPVAINYQAVDEGQFQGQLLTPVSGVTNCYDMDDFARPKGTSGSDLVSEVRRSRGRDEMSTVVQAAFADWSTVHLSARCQSAVGACSADRTSRIQVTLNQAFNSSWTSPGCRTYASLSGHLTVDCPTMKLDDAGADVHFNNSLSERAAETSVVSWKIFLGFFAGFGLVGGARAGFGARKLWTLPLQRMRQSEMNASMVDRRT